jgi:hypothetical protein
MISTLKNTFLYITMVAVLAPAVALGADFKVIASSDFTSTQITKSELRDIYLGTIKRVENGFVVQPTKGPLTTKHMEKFLTDVLEMSSREFVTHWRVKLFSSRGMPPKTLESDEQVIFYLHATPQSLGIVSPTADVGNLKVVSLVD